VSAKAADPAQATDKPKGKGKKGLVIALVAVLVLAGGGGGAAWYFMNKKGHDATAKEEPAHEEEAPSGKQGAAPVYLAMENMVLNLADPGGERVAQVGITLELESEKTVEKIKTLMPKVRSGVLMLVSQRTSDELLKRDGKEQLAIDIRAEVSDVLGYEVESSKPAKAKGDDADDEPAPRKKKQKRAAYSPVQGVLFSAFIVQ
jgi:flagellar FliL protein